MLSAGFRSTAPGPGVTGSLRPCASSSCPSAFEPAEGVQLEGPGTANPTRRLRRAGCGAGAAGAAGAAASASGARMPREGRGRAAEGCAAGAAWESAGGARMPSCGRPGKAPGRAPAGAGGCPAGAARIERPSAGRPPGAGAWSPGCDASEERAGCATLSCAIACSQGVHSASSALTSLDVPCAPELMRPVLTTLFLSLMETGGACVPASRRLAQSGRRRAEQTTPRRYLAASRTGSSSTSSGASDSRPRGRGWANSEVAESDRCRPEGVGSSLISECASSPAAALELAPAAGPSVAESVRIPDDVSSPPDS
mmetsp:Transcript_11585/g.45012  ORF Transcript_11585/g.45012 Transcript_11585/m.45012 type:complete len:312 (+) Transcript_11585:1073-2008(+)